MKSPKPTLDKKGKFGYGDIYTWTSICADSKLVPSWYVGRRDAESAQIFINDLASRLKNKVQLTTDGYRPYIDAIEDVFGADIEYSQLMKIYGVEKLVNERRYSPTKCLGTKRERITGYPDPKYISTSYVERQNLTMRMSMRRFTRLTNGFSKKVENLAHAVSLHFMYYNFVRIHKSLGVTPAMQAGVTDKLWELEDIINLIH